MKRFGKLFLVLVVMFGLMTGCGKSTEPKVEATNDDQISTEAEAETEVEVEAEIEVEDEVVATPTVEVIPEEPIIVVEQEQQDLAQSIWQYVAGGQFIDPTTTSIRVIKDEETGAKIINQNGNKEINETYFALVRPFLSGDDVVFVGNDEAFVFNENGVTRFDETGASEVLSYDNTSDSYSKSHTKIMWDQKNGCCISDGLRIKYVYDKETKGWKELETYVMLGTATERFDYMLVDLAEILDLDPDEIADWLINHDDANFESFKVARDANGEPAFIIVTGGEYALNHDDYLSAVDLTNQKYPDLIRTLVDQFGLRFIAQNTGIFDILEENVMDGRSPLGGIIIQEDPNIPFGAEMIMNTFIYDGRILYFEDHIVGAGGEDAVAEGEFVYLKGEDKSARTPYQFDQFTWWNVYLKTLKK